VVTTCSERRTISGQHAIVTPNGFDHVKASEPFSTGGGAWSGWLNADGVRTWCYYGQVSAWTYDFPEQVATSATLCVPDPSCYLRLYRDGSGSIAGAPIGANRYDCDTNFSLTATPAAGWRFEHWTGDVSSTSTSITFGLATDMTVYAVFTEIPERPPDPAPPGAVGGCESDCGSAWNPEPLILDLNGDGVRTTGNADRVWFDLDGNGSKDEITWTNGATMEGFLWLNLSGGKNCVDNGRELFGIGTRLPDGNPATTQQRTASRR